LFHPYVGVCEWQFGHSHRRLVYLLFDVFPSTWSSSSALFPVLSLYPFHPHTEHPSCASLSIRYTLPGILSTLESLAFHDSIKLTARSFASLTRTSTAASLPRSASSDEIGVAARFISSAVSGRHFLHHLCAFPHDLIGIAMVSVRRSHRMTVWTENS